MPLTLETQKPKPWATGPLELIEHAQGHLRGARTSFDYRIALISIDNAVEIAIRTFLSLPKRVVKRSIPLRKELENTFGFPELLDLLEKYANDLIAGIDLGEIEYYHKLRNNLYHQGNGITIEPAKVDGYLQIAKMLVGNLLKVEFESRSIRPEGAFQIYWFELQKKIKLLAIREFKDDNIQNAPIDELVMMLTEKRIIDSSFQSKFLSLQNTQNAIEKGNHLSGLDAGFTLGAISSLVNEIPV